VSAIADILGLSPVIPVLTIEEPGDALPLARALLEGGLRVMEVTLRTDAALDSISAIARAVPEAIVGAGTVLNRGDCTRARDAGARFAMSPGLTDALAEAPIPILPGVATASEIMRGLDLGLELFKFFPAEAMGGARALKSFAGPFGGVRFCPTGGITQDNAPSYLTLANVVCIGGTWIAPENLVARKDWSAIAALARAASGLRTRGVN
jgi:2-dehydro-3-deoxyphosphogluconate aldolase/(4S)-4-hydroxy-2-oxoglutarate aldolase